MKLSGKCPCCGQEVRSQTALMSEIAKLSEQQRQVVQILLDAKGTYVTADRIARILYGLKGEVTKANLSRVRSIITAINEKVTFIENAYSKGYRIRKDSYHA